jgi:hypothetical protein
MSDTESIDGFAIVELMGHQTIAGQVMTSVLGSTVMLRVDVPARGEQLGFTRYYGMSAIYSLTLVSEEVMLAALDELSPRPVTVYMPRLLPPKQTTSYSADAYEYRSDDEDDDHAP